jgi:hypothetical protein
MTPATQDSYVLTPNHWITFVGTDGNKSRINGVLSAVKASQPHDYSQYTFTYLYERVFRSPELILRLRINADLKAQIELSQYSSFLVYIPRRLLKLWRVFTDPSPYVPTIMGQQTLLELQPPQKPTWFDLVATSLSLTKLTVCTILQTQQETYTPPSLSTSP